MEKNDDSSAVKLTKKQVHSQTITAEIKRVVRVVVVIVVVVVMITMNMFQQQKFKTNCEI